MPRSRRQAIAALSRVGFHGKTNKDKLVFRDNSGVEAGKVSRLSLVGIHNCCAGCCKAAKDAIAKVEGVKADTLEPNKQEFVVEGDFDGAAVVKALNNVGFHVRKEVRQNGGKKKNAKKNANKNEDA